ncbi:GAF and ANTAR domain-containing protein [Dactylosporangium cerinum]|uniref:GAF and ANTAR domain-containing protein n=1 Tax=Dactylosporangium cerinum TaxID=1434730 RepID=A0ABV9WFN5_9ACTN
MELLERVCIDAARALSASGVGLSLMASDGVHGMAAASDPNAARLEELQFTFGEGPCIDAAAAGRPVLVPDLADGAMSRWPVYATAVLDAGVRAVFAFPLQVGAARLGVLDVFRSRSGSMSRPELGQALMFADQVVTTLLDGQERATRKDELDEAFERRSLDELDEAFEHRAQVFQAQGMVMVQLGSSLAEALARIRAYAYATDRSLSDVAADIVAHQLRLDTDSA